MSATPPEVQPHQRTLADTPFGGDAGSAEPATRQALADVASGDPTTYLHAVAQLCTARLLVPVVATRTSEGVVGSAAAGGLRSDKEAEMAVVLLQNADGARAMLAFTGMDALTGWDADSRPVPVTLDLAARSAVSDGATALLIDVAGPHPLVIDGDVLAELAAGHRLVDLGSGEFGWAVVSEGPRDVPEPRR